MGNPFADIDRLLAQFNTEWERAKLAVREALGSGFKVTATGLWKCRFKPYGSKEPQVIRAPSATGLMEQLKALSVKSVADRSAAAAAREKRKKTHLENVALARAEVKKLGGKRFKVRSTGGGCYRWTCQHGGRAPGAVREFDEGTADSLIASLRSHVQSLGR